MAPRLVGQILTERSFNYVNVIWIMAVDQAGAHTKSRRSSKRSAILRQAQKLFADYGYHGASIRDIAEASAVPPTLVLYHFESKDKLYEAVFEDVALHLEKGRQEKLGIFNAMKAAPPIEAILDALARPLMEMRQSSEGSTYARLIAREVSDPSEGSRGIVRRTLDPSAKEFLRLMVRALPDIPAPHVHWAFHYFIASLIWMCANTGRIRRLSGSECPTHDQETLIAQLVGFFTSALDSISTQSARGAVAHKTSAIRLKKSARRAPK